MFAFLYIGDAAAQSEIKIDVSGLQEPVEILKDEWGVNHIYASNQYDLFFTQGYTAAKDRLFQFEVWRMRATGTAAEILGKKEIQRDIGARLFKFRGDMTQEMNHYHPEGEEIITAYVDGVNAFIEEALSKPEELPVEFKILGIQPKKWTPEVVISRHQGLLGNINEELRLGMAVAKAGEKKVKDIMWFHPEDPDLKLDNSIEGELLSRDILDIYNAFRRGISFSSEDIQINTQDSIAVLERLNLPTNPDEEKHFIKGREGSNAWTVSGNRTASGYPILANDPHRGIAVPALRHMVHLVAPGWNVIGGGEPVIPGVSIGHNEYGAWGLTVYETDGEDLYVYDLNPENLNQYRYKESWKSMEQIQETIPVKDAPDEEVTLNYTVHGPVTYIDSTNHKAYAVKGAWLEQGGAPYLASLRMDQAKNWEEFREACSYSHIPGENMHWVDKEGNSGWQVVGITPIRENFSGMVPVPGDGRYEWAGYLPIKERPNLLNPDKGYFATSNQNVTPENYLHPKTINFTWADPFRGNRINEVLEENDNVTMEDMKDLQTDYFSIPARELVPMIKDVQMDLPLASQAKAYFQNWDYILNKESIAAGIYNMWERETISKAREDFVPEELKGLVGVQLTKVLSWLKNPGDKIGNDAEVVRDQFLKETFQSAVKELEEKLGNDIERWQYGQEKYKHVTMNNRLPGLLNDEMKEKVDLGPLPRGGNSHTPNSTGGYDNQYSGASFRLLVDVADWDKALMISSPGQSSDPENPNYSNLFELWAEDNYFPAYYSKDKIQTVTKERIMLHPER